MAESLQIPQTQDRAKIYEALLPQIQALIEGEKDLIANQANLVAALKQAFNFFWVGFYWVKESPTARTTHELVLGPFQGPIACTRIAFTRGVCGHAYTTRKTVLVPNVDEFPGHIACSSATKSEIVVPVFDRSGAVVGVLDVDSDRLNDFSEIDVRGLEAVVSLLSETL